MDIKLCKSISKFKIQDDSKTSLQDSAGVPNPPKLCPDNFSVTTSFLDIRDFYKKILNFKMRRTHIKGLISQKMFRSPPQSIYECIMFIMIICSDVELRSSMG